MVPPYMARSSIGVRFIQWAAAAMMSLAYAAPAMAGGPSTLIWGSPWLGGALQLPNSFMLLENGERVGTWMVAGQRGNVAWARGGYTHNGFTFPAQRPHYETTGTWVNLAGISQSATGLVHSPMQTTVGASYTLGFYIGNVVDPAGIYGTSSSINVYIGQTFAGTFTNSDGAGSKTMNWKYVSLTFTATTPYTSIAFINGDPPGDMLCGFDSPTFGPAAAAVKAPLQ